MLWFLVVFLLLKHHHILSVHSLILCLNVFFVLIVELLVSSCMVSLIFFAVCCFGVLSGLVSVANPSLILYSFSAWSVLAVLFLMFVSL